MVLCAGEMTQAEVLGHNQPAFSIGAGQAERSRQDHVGQRTTSLFRALDVAIVRAIGHRQDRSDELCSFFDRVEAAIPPDIKEVQVILDNSATHRTFLMQEWFGAHPRYHRHFAPASALWLNLVERFYSELANRRLRGGSFRTTRQLKRAIDAYLSQRNKTRKPFTWTKSANAILATIATHRGNLRRKSGFWLGSLAWFSVLA